MEMYSNVAQPLHILLVDDDEGARNLLEGFFVEQGCSVSSARGPAEALEIVKSMVPDAIFSSLVFSGINGFELCRELRGMPATASKFIAALTELSIDGVEEIVLNAGFDRCLLKPVDSQLLLSLVNGFKTQ